MLAQQLHEFGQRTEAREAKDVEEIGAGCYKRCDAGHPSLALYRGEVGIESDVESAGSTIGKGFGQDGHRSCLTKGSPGPSKWGMGTGLWQNEAGLRIWIEQLEQDFINLRA